MSLTEYQRTGTFGLPSPLVPQPKKTVNFNFEDSMKSINDDKIVSSTKNTKKNEQCMPVNFFHSPGEYNKMIIRCAAPVVDSFVERKMGIIKNLQFLNQPLFEKQKEKKYQRVAEYTQKMRKKRGEKSESAVQSCTCCCCDSFCWECVKQSTCEVTSLKEQIIKKEGFLIDIQAVKRGEKPKKNINKPKKTLDLQISKEIEDSHFCCQKKEGHRVRIERLINESLLKEIQIQREKELNKLSVKEREKMKEYFNQSVRQFNRTHSAPKIQESKVVPPTKKQLRDAYWNSVKNLVSFELKKDKVEVPLSKKEEVKEIPKREFRLTAEQMHVKRILNGQEAMREQKICKIYQKKLQKMKAKKLMALADEQTEIIKKNRKKKFKPSQTTLEQAFKILQ